MIIGLFLYESSAINNQEINFLIKSSKVNIELEDTTIDQYITPKQVVDYQLKVTNKGLPCLIRFKIIPNDIKLTNNKYKYHDGYYYDSDCLMSDCSKVLVDNLQIDEDLLVNKQNQLLDFEIVVEAVQYHENINWNDIEIQKFKVE